MKKQFNQGQIYHIFNRSIAHFKIFRYENDFNRILSLFEYYNQDFEISYSDYNKRSQKFYPIGLMNMANASTIKILGYCIMPDHYHLIVKTILENNCIIKYFSIVENAYAKYFNVKSGRHGHLWSESFKSVMVNSNEQFLYLTKYVHLNPVKAMIVRKAEEYTYSSFQSYMNVSNLRNMKEISIDDPKKYKSFIDSHKEYDKKIEDMSKNRILID